jgi:hypothetical protein
MTISSATQHNYPYQNKLTWSRSEKAVADTAFDGALGRELHEVIQKTKQMANAIRHSADLWDLEHYLTQHRNRIRRKEVCEWLGDYVPESFSADEINRRLRRRTKH